MNETKETLDGTTHFHSNPAARKLRGLRTSEGHAIFCQSNASSNLLNLLRQREFDPISSV